jgi:hypothetical protein
VRGSSDLSTKSAAALDVSAYEQSFVFPTDVATMAISDTKFGISSKELIGQFASLAWTSTAH